MYTEKTTQQIEVTETDHVQVRSRTTVLKDGVVVASTLHRHVIAPGQDYSNESKKVRRMAASAHIPTVVARHSAEKDYDEAVAKLDRDNSEKNKKEVTRKKKDRDKKRRDHEIFEQD